MKNLIESFDNPVKIEEWFSGSDSLGNRIKKTLGSNITKYIIDPNRTLPSVLAETDASGNITSYYVYGLGLISKIESANAYFYQYDGLGSTVAVTDSTGAIKNKYAYDDFGNLDTNSTETIANPFKYVGKFGVATDLPDLLFMRARYYMPSVGRFINKDPIGLAGGFNLYLYTKNNPLNLTDPTGKVCGAGWNDPIVPDKWWGRYDFTEACRRHDICYDACGKSRYGCDKAFLGDMIAECNKLKGFFWYDCIDTAYVYYIFVRAFGGLYYYHK